VSSGATCTTIHVGLDHSHANDYALAVLALAPAQVFLADDSLVDAITVWRPATVDTNVTGMHLWICAVDSTLRPLAGMILLDGPTVLMPVIGPADAPVRFELTPPFALPARHAHYAFAVKASEPTCDLGFPLLADSVQDYAGGAQWTMHPFSGSDCGDLGSHGDLERGSLIFDIEFCEPSTPASRKTWGLLKAQYR
jgi:hypothetical protein